MDNIAGKDADVQMEDTENVFKIPDSAKATINIKSDKDTSTFTAKGPNGNSLYLNGQERLDVKANDVPSALVIHNKGNCI